MGNHDVVYFSPVSPYIFASLFCSISFNAPNNDDGSPVAQVQPCKHTIIQLLFPVGGVFFSFYNYFILLWQPVEAIAEYLFF